MNYDEMIGSAPSSEERFLGRAKEALLAVTARMLRSQGYAATSIRDIAAEAGILSGSIYAHFRSKDEMVQIVLDRGIQRVDVAVREAVAAADGGAWDRLDAAVIAHLRTILLQSDFTFASIHAFRSVPPEIRRANARMRDRYEEQWKGLIADCLSPSTKAEREFARSVRFLLLGGMNAVVDWYHDDGPLTLEEIGRNFVRAVGRPEH